MNSGGRSAHSVRRAGRHRGGVRSKGNQFRLASLRWPSTVRATRPCCLTKRHGLGGLDEPEVLDVGEPQPEVDDPEVLTDFVCSIDTGDSIWCSVLAIVKPLISKSCKV